MKFKKIYLSTLFLVALGSLCASAEPVQLTTTTPEGRIVSVQVISENILKVTNSLPGEKEITSNKLGQAVDYAMTTTQQFRDSISVLTTGKVTAMMNTRNGSLTIIGGSDRHPCALTDDGVRRITDGKLELELSTTATGAYYGAGERGHKLNLRGDTLVMYNRPTYGYGTGDPRINQMNITMPLVVSEDGFALVFDDHAASELILSNPVRYITESPGAVSYFFVNGASSMAEVVENLTSLTGRQNLPPLWALGYITSKYGYKTQAETEEVVKRLKSLGYPLDGLVLDLYWYGKEQDMGRLDWEPEQWPEAEKMLAKLGRQGVNVVPISQPYVLRNGKGVENYDSLAPKGVFVRDSLGNPLQVEIWVGEGGMFDVSNPDTRAWLAKRYAELTDMGVGGWWGDLGEPEQHPYASRHANGLKGREYHNRYGNDWSQIISDLFEEKYPDRRLFSLMRGGTIGLQQFSVFPWSGDVARTWGGLEPQIRIMLNSGLSGLGYMSHDVGGFAVDEANPIDPELYVRWLQLGLFSPVLRTHSQQYAEPYHYPDQADIVKQLILDRYRWLPYNYTLAFENAAYGWPLVRPLNFHDRGPAGCDTIVDEYLWGRDVLIAPVLTQGATARPVVFPEGRWVDYRNPRVSYTGAINSYDAPLDVLPIFIRAGSFIPQADYKMDSTGDYDPGRLTVTYYPGDRPSSFFLYDDNRLSPQTLRDDQYRLIEFDGETSDKNISISISSEGTYEGAPRQIDIDFRVAGLGAAPRSVAVSGVKTTKFKYDDATGLLSFRLRFIPDATTEISINF